MSSRGGSSAMSPVTRHTCALGNSRSSSPNIAVETRRLATTITG